MKEVVQRSEPKPRRFWGIRSSLQGWDGSGPLSQWLFSGCGSRLPVSFETRHIRRCETQSKTDRKTRGIAQNWRDYRPVHVNARSQNRMRDPSQTTSKRCHRERSAVLRNRPQGRNGRKVSRGPHPELDPDMRYVEPCHQSAGAREQCHPTAPLSSRRSPASTTPGVGPVCATIVSVDVRPVREIQVSRGGVGHVSSINGRDDTANITLGDKW